MNSSMPDMTISGYGTANRAGVPAYDNNGGVRTVGGYVSNDNTLPAKFGLAMYATAQATDALIVGKSQNNPTIFKGILMNRQSVNQQSPAHAEYLINGMVGDCIYHGGVWVKITTGNATIGSAVFSVDDTGEIGAGTAQGGQTAIAGAKIVSHDASTGLSLIYIS